MKFSDGEFFLPNNCSKDPKEPLDEPIGVVYNSRSIYAVTSSFHSIYLYLTTNILAVTIKTQWTSKRWNYENYQEHRYSQVS